MVSKIRFWEITGVVFVLIAGSLLHFTYDWFNHSKLAAIFSAVNESIYEHLKITFWPILIYSIFEYIALSKITNNFIIAKAACLLVTLASMVIMFYGYTALTRQNFLIADIAVFILSICFGQITSYKILTKDQLKPILSYISMLIILILIIIFSLFTLFPPKSFLFKDPVHENMM